MALTTYLDAIREGMAEEMRRDPSVYILGEDVAIYGGAFKTTKGLVDEFGADRVIDTPISEAAIVGAAIGSAFMGRRPIAEMQFIDFIASAFNQIVNFAAKANYRWGQKCPIVIRGPSGGGVSGGPYHSQNPEAYFMNVPGLKIVAPAFPYDAKGLIKAAIRDDNPVLYFEHKFLYRRLKDDLPEEDYIVPIGKARVVREGEDLSIITYGAMVHTALEAAAALEKRNIHTEVVDLRSLVPYDRETIRESVVKTSKALVLYEACRTGGFGAEIAAYIAGELFDWLDGPVMRLASPDTPVPFSPPLEKAWLPSVDKVISAAAQLYAY